MADLNELQSAGTTKVVGAASNGAETNAVGATPTGDLLAANIANTSAIYGPLTVTTTPIEAKVGVSRLTNRKTLTITNTSGAAVYYGFNSSVSSTTGAPILADQSAIFSIGDALAVWLVAASGSRNVRITEMS